MTDRLKEIEELERLATPGPWRSGRRDMQSYTLNGDAFTNVYADSANPKIHLGLALAQTVARTFDEEGNNKNDADFIAHSRADIPWLLERLRDAEDVIASGPMTPERIGYMEKYKK